MEEIEGIDVAFKLKEKINELTKVIDENQQIYIQKERENIKDLIESKIEKAKLGNVIQKIEIFIINFDDYYDPFNVKLTEEVFDLYIDGIIDKYVNKEETYSKLIEVIKMRFEKIDDNIILRMTEHLFGTDVISEKDKTKYLVNHGSLNHVTVIDNETIKKIKNDFISLFNLVLKYEMRLIPEKEFKVKSSNIYFGILRNRNVSMLKGIMCFSESLIDKMSGTKENAEKIKNDIRNWIKEQSEELTLSSIDEICEESREDLMDYIYLFSEVGLTASKVKYIKELDEQLEELKSDEVIKENPEKAIKMLDNISKKYNKIMNLK